MSLAFPPLSLNFWEKPSPPSVQTQVKVFSKVESQKVEVYKKSIVSTHIQKRKKEIWSPSDGKKYIKLNFVRDSMEQEDEKVINSIVTEKVDKIT